MYCCCAAAFSASLGARNGVAAERYRFEFRTVSSNSGNYANDMITECKKAGMKPVCDHPSYCKNDAKSLYLGQAHHMAYRPHRNINSWFPSGWSSISSHWNGLCTYTGAHGGNAKTLCNIPINTHDWRAVSQSNPGFICGSVASERLPASTIFRRLSCASAEIKVVRVLLE